ncbi:TPA: type III secretion system LEE translocated intimin receptor Tir [Escherichia coli]|uniref:type III secretion system LEE translocated intimin receptor Tir n=1 Tax=Escherichia coli TaxID=562 RepID=UPI00069B1DC4|nr:type III secretion system LEE translocated intimin receptor Tir [Escherichia coli]EFN9944918.1 type III secretion system LEE translocated intimin receptor Tir [Escherichia coli]EGA8981918.1 type III secretion system LEE translocated intimin receptor Tir [Escherichia coli]EGO4217365.1 type III secretion system LEE translocated intimin receptor Tir [Escherichia coli]EHW2659743.1 type III secretion system LEE translocated intimin receptor Tir [Escherichia coli]EHW3040665.1 type III secretion s
MPIGNLGNNVNSNHLIPPAPPLPSSQTDGAVRGGTGHLISSTGALGSRSLFSPLRNSMADSVDSRDIPGLPVPPSLLAATSETCLHGGFEVLHDKGPLDTLNQQIGASAFRIEQQSDGSYAAIGEKKGVEVSVTLSSQELSSLRAIDIEGKDRFVFTGGRGGSGHSMVTAASDIADARVRIMAKLDPNNHGGNQARDVDTRSVGVGSASGIDDGVVSETHTSTTTSSVRSDPKFWVSVGAIAAGLAGLAATGIAQALALTPEPDDPATTDPDQAANAAESATKDQLTQEAFKNPENQKVNIDANGNAIPSGELKDDIVEQIAQQAKEAGEVARQQAVESNAQAQQRYDDQHARRQEELQLSSGIGYGLSSALIVAGGIGAGVTTALHRRNQPAEQTTTTTTHTVVQQQTGGNTPAQGGTDATRAEDASLNRRDSQGSVASTHWSDSSSEVVNPYAEVGEPRNSLSTRQQEEHIYDEVAADPVYSVIQNFSRNAPVTGRLMGSPGQGIQSTYALLASSAGLRLGMGGLTGSGESAVNTANAAPTPGPVRFV